MKPGVEAYLASPIKLSDKEIINLLDLLIKGEGIVSRASWFIPLAEELKEKE